MANQGKSGYEIRVDLLTLAEGVLINNIENERQPIYMWNENHPESKKDLPLRTYPLLKMSLILQNSLMIL